MMVYSSFALYFAGKSPIRDVQPGTFNIQFFRANTAVGSFLLYTYSLTILPLGMVVIFLNLAPFWTTLLAHFINGEKVSYIEISAMVICFTCILGMTLQKDNSAEGETMT